MTLTKLLYVVLQCYFAHQHTCSNLVHEAQLSQRDRAAAYLNYGKNISAKSVHLGYFFKSPVATVSSTHYPNIVLYLHYLGSLIMSMPASVTWQVRHVLHTVRIGHFYPS